VRHTAAECSRRDDSAPSGRASRLAIRNNLFEDVGANAGAAEAVQVPPERHTPIEHNTAFQTGSIVTAEGEPNPGFVYRDNIAPHNAYGIVGTGVASGLPTRAAFFPDGVFRRNVIAGGNAERYPADNFFPATLDEVGFVDRARRLPPWAASPYRRAGSDGADVGATSRARSGWGWVVSAALWEAKSTGARPRAERRHAPSSGRACCCWPMPTSAIRPAAVWASLRPRPFRTGPQEPSVTLVIAAQRGA
jgi:hypothetical protein